MANVNAAARMDISGIQQTCFCIHSLSGDVECNAATIYDVILEHVRRDLPPTRDRVRKVREHLPNSAHGNFAAFIP